MKRILLCAAFVVAFSAPAAAQQSAKDKEWTAHCVSQISETNKSRAQIYCRCMAEAVDTSAAEKLRQTDLERSYPPVHRECFSKAGFKIPN